MKMPKTQPRITRLWQITNTTTGEVLGTFRGATEMDALNDAANSGATAPDDLDDLRVEYDGFETLVEGDGRALAGLGL